MREISENSLAIMKLYRTEQKCEIEDDYLQRFGTT